MSTAEDRKWYRRTRRSCTKLPSILSVVSTGPWTARIRGGRVGCQGVVQFMACWIWSRELSEGLNWMTTTAYVTILPANWTENKSACNYFHCFLFEKNSKHTVNLQEVWGKYIRLTVMMVGLSMVNKPKAVKPIGALVSWVRNVVIYRWKPYLVTVLLMLWTEILVRLKPGLLVGFPLRTCCVNLLHKYWKELHVPEK